MKGTAYRTYMLVLLMVILTFSHVDRLAMGVLLQDIKRDLLLSDTQLGFLTGIAFAAFYSLMGIPLARWADRGNRVVIVTLTTGVWSVMVALCGLASNFVQLMLVRIGVAVGEAGCQPVGNSLIGDYYTRPERPRAVGIYMLAMPFAAVIGYFGAGWLNEFYGWRKTFLLLGLPGVVLALLAFFTLREPRQSERASQGDTPPAANPSLTQVCGTLWRIRSFRHLLLCYSIISFFGYGITQWKPAFFIRSFGLDSGVVGSWFGLIYGFGGLLGLYWGGSLASRFAPNDERLQMRGMACAIAGFGIVSVCIYLSPSPILAFFLLAVSLVGYFAINGPLFASIQTLVPPHMRAMAIALLFLFSNLIGMGLGPLLAGFLSDLFASWAGQESLRYSLVALSPGYVWAALHMWLASRTVAADVTATQRLEAESADTGAVHRLLRKSPVQS